MNTAKNCHGYHLSCPDCGWEETFLLDAEDRSAEEWLALITTLCQSEGNPDLTAFFHSHPEGTTKTAVTLYYCRTCATYCAKEKHYFRGDGLGYAPPNYCDNCGGMLGIVKKLSALSCPMCEKTLNCKKIGKGAPYISHGTYHLRFVTENVIEKALHFAADAHCGAVRKGSSLPYLLHPCEAASIVASFTDDEDLIAAALLHDVIEDTDFSETDIEACFGARIAALVAAESENKREHLPAEDTWRTRKEETLCHLRSASYDVKAIALGDKLSNIRAIHTDYMRIGAALWERFNQHDPAAHAWYYQSIAEILEADFGDTAAWQEYRARIAATFKK